MRLKIFLLITFMIFSSNLLFSQDCDPEKLFYYFNSYMYHKAEEKKDNENKIMCVLNKGIDPNLKNEDGESILYLSSVNGLIDAVKLLIENDVDVNNTTWFGNTSLIAASGKYGFDIAKLLIENGADVNIGDDNGYTALIIASRSGNVDTVKLLIENGADVNMRTSKICNNDLCKNQRGWQDMTALDFAKQSLEYIKNSPNAQYHNKDGKLTNYNNEDIKDYEEIIKLLEEASKPKDSIIG